MRKTSKFILLIFLVTGVMWLVSSSYGIAQEIGVSTTEPLSLPVNDEIYNVTVDSPTVTNTYNEEYSGMDTLKITGNSGVGIAGIGTVPIEIWTEGITPPKDFEDGFSSPVLDSDWEVIDTYPGHGYYSLTANPGYLRYYLQAWSQSWQDIPTPPNQWGYIYYPCMRLVRSFSGTDWTFETKVTYYMPRSNGRDEVIGIWFGDRQKIIWFGTHSDQAGYGVSCHYVWISSGSNYVTVPLPNVAYYTYYYKVIRQGDNFDVMYSTDGNNYTTAFTMTMNVNGLQQKVVIGGTSWATPRGSYADYDYIKIKRDLVTLMLGEKIKFSATMNQQPVNVKWTTQTSSTIKSPLFPDNIGIFFDPQTEDSGKEFQTVHLGEGKITVSAIIYGKDVKAEKKIKVVKPSQLGTDYNKYDSLIVDTANNTGILPQYIKGHIDIETLPKFKFDPKSYRYEPKYDFIYIQPIKGDAPFIIYALEDGSGVNLTNKEPRDKYSIDRNWVFPQEPHTEDVHKLQDSDRNVLCSNIFYNNPKQNWPKKDLEDYWKKKTDFTAQTIISASYGLTQMMYYSAVDEGKFKNQDPIELLLPIKNMEVAGNIYKRRWKWKVPKPAIYYPEYKDEKQWEEEWFNFFQKWNDAGDKSLSYGKKVIDASEYYLPQ